MKISGLVICHNEAHVIARCLSSLAWVDDLVVVDAESSDKTAELCKDPNAPWAKKLNFFTRPWEGFRSQRMFALSKARHDWCLVLDSDEECSVQLKEKIKELLSQTGGPPIKAYKIRRQEYFLGKKINFGIWNPSYQDRFFLKRDVYYKNEIHEYPIFPVEPGRIHEPIEHWPDFSPEKFLYKMNKYTSIEALDRVRAGQTTTVFKLFFAFPAMFLKNYFYYKAYRDGKHGFVISLLEGLSRVVRHVKIWQYTHINYQKK